MGWVCLCGAAFGSKTTHLCLLAGDVSKHGQVNKGKFKSLTRSSFSLPPPPLSSCWFKYQLNSLNIPIKARDKSCVMYAPSCSSLLFATHSTSSLPLGAKFTWEIKNLLSLDPIDIWASISEIITASGQYPATFRSRCDDGLGGAGGSVATWSSRKGAVLCLGGCVHFWVCVFVSFRLRCTVHTLSHRVCRDGSVEVWKTDFVPFVSRRAAPLVLLGWRYEESQWGKKRHSSL